MTKDELAKKRGLAIKNEDKSPSDALLTVPTKEQPKKSNDTQKPVATKQNASTSVVNKSTKAAPNPLNQAKKLQSKEVNTIKATVSSETTKESKIGRPKGPDTKKLSLNVPEEYTEYITIAAGIKYKGNISSYINALIKKDIDENGKVYNQIKELTK